MRIAYCVLRIWETATGYAIRSVITLFGKEAQVARGALDEAVQLFLETASDIGTLKEVLEEAGYEFKQENWVSPLWISTERHFTVVGA